MLLCAGQLYYIFYFDDAEDVDDDDHGDDGNGESDSDIDVEVDDDGDSDSDTDEDAPPGGASWFGEVSSRSTWGSLRVGTGAYDMPMMWKMMW